MAQHSQKHSVQPGKQRDTQPGSQTGTQSDTDDLQTGSFPVIKPETPQPTRKISLKSAIEWLVIIVLCAGLGFGFVVQRQSAQSNYSSLSENELVRLLYETNRQITQLESQRSTLSNQLTSIQQAVDKQRQIQQVAKENEEASGILSGRLAAQGKGISITVKSGTRIPAAALFNLIEELRNAGAEVIQFNTVRVVTSTSFVDTKTSVSCDGILLQSPYTIRAIGDPDALSNAISIAGGVGSTLRVQYNARVSVEKRSRIVISALAPTKTYSYATPVKDDTD